MPTPSQISIATGACFCGAIAAEMCGIPLWVCYDHDDDCRRAIGSPLMIWVGYRLAEFRLLRGEPKSFSKTPGVVRTFCADCGTSISYQDAALADEFYVAIGFFDHPQKFSPQVHAYWQMKLPYVNFSDDLPRTQGYSRTRDARSKEPGNPTQDPADADVSLDKPDDGCGVEH